MAYYFSCLEAYLVWCIWLILGFFMSYAPGWNKGDTILRYHKLHNILSKLPYEEILFMMKNKSYNENISSFVTSSDILFYAFMMNPSIRLGLRAALIVILLTVDIGCGLDVFILYICVAFLSLFAIIKFGQGLIAIL